MFDGSDLVRTVLGPRFDEFVGVRPFTVLRRAAAIECVDEIRGAHLELPEAVIMIALVEAHGEQAYPGTSSTARANHRAVVADPGRTHKYREQFDGY